MKRILLVLDEKDHKKLLKLKGQKTWEEFIMQDLEVAK